MELWKYIKNRMQNNLQQIVYEDNNSITYRDLIFSAEDFSKKLKGLKCCAVMCESEMMAGVAILSCFAAEVTALPLSKRYGEIHCNKILDTISPDAIITDRDGRLQVIHLSGSNYNESGIHPAVIMCTSGTTGVPKGAMLTETNIITNVSDIAKYFEINSNDTILISTLPC